MMVPKINPSDMIQEKRDAAGDLIPIFSLGGWPTRTWDGRYIRQVERDWTAHKWLSLLSRDGDGDAFISSVARLDEGPWLARGRWMEEDQ
jgi:hypothetical protein